MEVFTILGICGVSTARPRFPTFYFAERKAQCDQKRRPRATYLPVSSLMALKLILYNIVISIISKSKRNLGT